MDKQHKKQLKRYIAWGALALLVILLAVMPLIAGKTVPADGPQASILMVQADNRTIETLLIGGGQLSSNATQEITIPAEVKLTEYLVGNGDIVKKGDAIAAVDKVSVLSALAQVQETLDYLAGSLADAAGSGDPDEIKAHAGGLVKVLYGQPGDSVREVMLEHGALAILSLDGRMAVEISCSTDLKTGSTVCVYPEDGSEVEGAVESSAGGRLVVSIEDKGYDIGEKVIVETEEGRRLGSGSLDIHAPWNATAYYGTISRVNVREGMTLTAGKTLFELDVDDYSASFQILNAQRQEYEALMLELFRMYDSGVITAPFDGIVTGVDTNGAFLLSSSQEQTWQVQLLRNVVWNTPPAFSLSLLNSEETSGEESPSEDQPGDDPSGSETPVSCTQQDNCPAQVHEPGCPNYQEPIPGGNVFEVQSVTETGITLRYVSGSDSYNPAQLDVVQYPDGTPIAANDLVILSADGSIQKIGTTGSSRQEGMSGMEGMGNMPGGMGGMGSMGGMGGAVQTFEPYSLETLTIAAVTSQESLTLEITVDEQDIASISTGQEATITVEALTGQSFPATVTSVSNTGTNEGGNSKFTAKLTLNQSGDMLPGMNASAFLTLNTTENVLTLPVAALVEEGTKTMVYTGFSEQENILTDPVEVLTGISDGEYVQILSGLSLGDTVYYAYYDTPEFSNIPRSGGLPF